VNLLSAEQDRLLYVSIRHAENEICFNAREATGDWGVEECVLLLGVFQKADATIIIHLHKSAVIVYTFARRIPKDVKGILYSCSGTSIFADSVALIITAFKSPDPTTHFPTSSTQAKYFPLSAADVAKESEATPFDYVIIGSGIGGGVLAADLLDKNKRLAARHSKVPSQSTPANGSAKKLSLRLTLANGDQAKRILVLERGGLLFHTHSLNTPCSPSLSVYGQVNDLFYNQYKREWDMDGQTRKIWQGGPVYCLGGRSAVWRPICHRYGSLPSSVEISSEDRHLSMSDCFFRSHFHPSVYDELKQTYLRKAEDCMNVTDPEMLPLHDELLVYLNARTRGSHLPASQWTWGRLASDPGDKRKRSLGFAPGAYSSIDRLLEAAIDDQGRSQFKTVLDSAVSHLEPKPEAGKLQSISHVVAKDASGAEHRIRTKNVVVSAGAVESAAILLRSMGGDMPSQAFGDEFARGFGQVTDHRIFFVALPFYYRNMEYVNVLDGMELMTDVAFGNIDNTSALATVSLDASSFLPRQNLAESSLPQFIIAFTLPSALSRDSKVTLNAKREPHLTIGYGDDPHLDDKKEVLRDFAIDVMNKFADKLDLQFVQHDSPRTSHVPIARVTRDIVRELRALGPGVFGHELGSIPMATQTQQGIVDKNLKMRHGWDNVYVCDLSVFPYSPASPSLSLAALALRLSDHLVPPEEPADRVSRVHDTLRQHRSGVERRGFRGADEVSKQRYKYIELRCSEA
jgi:choline dehydrogenase-like flavoprotein